MSAESTLVFWGLRYEVPRDELALLDNNTHPDIKRARQNGLDYFGGNFGEPAERYFLFVGRELGMLGREYSAELLVDEGTLRGVIGDTTNQLQHAGFEGSPQLFIQWMPDS